MLFSANISCRRLQLILLAVLSVGCADIDVDDDNESEVSALVSEALVRGLPSIPPELAVPAGHRLSFALQADGVQIYDCKAAADGTHAWTFRAPEANLFGRRGRLAGTHYAGPTWEALDGSTVVAARVAGAAVDATAIPWLLLEAVSHEGRGRMARVAFIQRISTSGGLAPSSGCDATQVGAVAEVDYTATYTFYEAKCRANP